MSTTPAPCDLLLTAHTVLTQNDAREVITDGAVAIKGGDIVAVGPATDLRAAYAPAQTIDCGFSLLMPGLINAHTHASMSLLRGYADDLPLMAWLQQHIWPAESHLTAERVHLGAMLACAEMIRYGTTTFADMYLLERETARAVDTTGMRAALGEGIFVFPSPAYAKPEAAWDVVEAFHDEYGGHERITPIIVPHAVYTTTPDLLTRAYQLAEKYDTVFHIHASETAFENAQAVENLGKRPVPYLDSLGVLSQRTLLAHGVHLTDEEITRLAETGTHVAHCPESNMKLASGVARVANMLDAGVNVALGTDGPASNNDLNMFTEMTSAALLAKVSAEDPTALPASSVLDMATREGAAALAAGHAPTTGQLAPGMRADVIALDLNAPNLAPLYHADSHAAYAANGSEVHLTMVGGEVLYREGAFTRFDYAGLREEVTAMHDFFVQKKSS